MVHGSTVRQQPGVDTDENEENREDEGLDGQETRVERSDASYVRLINDLITAKCVRPAIPYNVWMPPPPHGRHSYRKNIISATTVSPIMVIEPSYRTN